MNSNGRKAKEKNGSPSKPMAAEEVGHARSAPKSISVNYIISNAKMGEPVARVAVLSKGNVIRYFIPSFPAIKVDLIEVKLQWYEEETQMLHMFDGFARYCDQMDCELPALAEIRCSNDSAFLIEVSDQYVMVATFSSVIASVLLFYAPILPAVATQQ